MQKHGKKMDGDPLGIHLGNGVISYQFRVGNQNYGDSFKAAKDGRSLLRLWMEADSAKELFTEVVRRISKYTSFLHFVLVVPDYCGLWECTQITRVTDAAELPVLRILSESMAAALVVTGRKKSDEEENVLIACLGGGARSLVSYRITNGVAETMRRILSFPVEDAGGEEEAAVRFMAALTYCDGWLDCSQIILAGSAAERARYQALLKRGLERAAENDEKKKLTLERAVFLQEETDIFPLGGMLQAMLLMGHDLNLLALPAAPKALFLSHGEECWRLLAPDTTVPARNTLDLSGSHRDPFWYEGIWTLYECGPDLVPEPLSQFGIEIAAKTNKLSAGVGITIDIDNTLDFALRMDIGNAHKQFTAEMFPMIEREKKAEPADTEQKTPDDSSAEQLILKLLPVVDSLEYGVRFIRPDDDSPHAQGLIRILRQAKDMLAQMEVTEIPAQDRPFDSALHNAVVRVPDITLPPNTVREVVHTGYLYRGKVLRYADVIVSC